MNAVSQQAPAGAVGSSQDATSRLAFLFPTVVQVSDIPNAPDINRNLMQAINAVIATTPNNLPSSWACHLYTTIHSPLDLLARPDFGEVKRQIEIEASRFADHLRIDRGRGQLKIQDCWLNVYSTADSQEIHCHANSLVSGVYYVKAPPGSSPLTFHHPLADEMLKPSYVEMTDINCYGASFEAIEGRMILFRSSLRHSVKPSKISDQRVSIAFNLTL